MQTVQHNRSNDYYRSTSSHDLPSQSQASHRHWWTSLATPVYFTLDHSPYLNRYGMVNPVHWVCFLRGPPRFINVRVGSGFVPSSFLSHLPSFLRQRCARCGGMVKYILVWRWTDKSFSIDRLKYKLRFERSPSPIYGRDNSSAFYRSSLSSKGRTRFPHLKTVPCVCYSHSLFRVHSLLCFQSCNIFLDF